MFVAEIVEKIPNVSTAVIVDSLIRLLVLYCNRSRLVEALLVVVVAWHYCSYSCRDDHSSFLNGCYQIYGPIISRPREEMRIEWSNNRDDDPDSLLSPLKLYDRSIPTNRILFQSVPYRDVDVVLGVDSS